MLAVEVREDHRRLTDEALDAHACPDVLVNAVAAVFGMRGPPVSCRLVRLDALPGRTWENGASLRLFCGVDDVQDFAIFARTQDAKAMVRWLFGGGAPDPVTSAWVWDGLAETLNHVVGRIKTVETTAQEIEPTLDTPEFLDATDAESYAHVHPTASVYRVTSHAWEGEVVFMASPKRQRAIAALEQATALLIRSGLEPGATVRACRLLEVVRTPVLALSELPSMGITLSWCVENLAALVNGDGGYGERAVFHRVLGELEGLHGALVRLTAAPETTAFVIPPEEDMRVLLHDFCWETLRGIERVSDLSCPCPNDAPQSPFGLMHTVQVTSGFFHLTQLECLARGTGRLIGSVRECGAKMTAEQVEAVRHSVALIEDWVGDLLAGLDVSGTVAWSPEIEAHTRMLDHVVECGGHIVIHSQGTVTSGESGSVGQGLRLEQPQLRRLEALQAEVREWAELARSQGRVKPLAVPGEFLDRADHELVSICRSVRRVPMGPILARLVRHCREASARHRKLVRVEMSGDSLHAPEHLMAGIAGVLVHLVNNAIEHGIEDGPERGRQGKKVLALVEVRAQRIDGALVFEVADDGRGMPRAVLRAHAERSTSTVGWSDGGSGDVYRLRSRSEAALTEQASGRSGMDAVVREVEAVGGVVEVASTPGKGTRVRIVVSESEGNESDDDDFSGLHEEGELTFL